MRPASKVNTLLKLYPEHLLNRSDYVSDVEVLFLEAFSHADAHCVFSVPKTLGVEHYVHATTGETASAIVGSLVSVVAAGYVNVVDAERGA